MFAWLSIVCRIIVGIFALKVEAMLDKTIFTMATMFIESFGSLFIEDILQLCKDWGSASLCDEYICQGEQANFTTDDEE